MTYHGVFISGIMGIYLSRKHDDGTIKFMKHSAHSIISDTLKRRVTQVQQGGARAAVLGINDGLVSVLCIVLGVAAAGGSTKAVLTAGFAGLLAGAISMAAGEWISVKSQVELFEGVLKDIQKALGSDRALLADNLAHTLSHSGMDSTTAHAFVAEVSKSDRHLMELYSRQVVGINADELGSPWRAAIASFALFVVGSLVPLFPWFFGGGYVAIIVSIVLTALGGLVVGGVVARLSGKALAYGAFRQLGIIVVSALVTYGIGYAFGAVTH